MERMELEGGLYMYADPSFALGADAVQLAHFASRYARPGMRILDAGCGAGAVMLLMAAACPGAVFVGAEIRESAAGLASLAACEQNLPVRAVCADLRTLPADEPFSPGSFDMVVSNPPYFPLNGGKLPADPGARIARTEECLTLDELCKAAARLLRHHGDFCAVIPPARLPELMGLCARHGMEPREMAPVFPRTGENACMVLLRAVKGARPGGFVVAPGGRPLSQMNRAGSFDSSPEGRAKL